MKSVRSYRQITPVKDLEVEPTKVRLKMRMLKVMDPSISSNGSEDDVVKSIKVHKSWSGQQAKLPEVRKPPGINTLLS